MAKILLVEDDTSLRTAYSMILSANKYDLEAACNGKEALDKLKKFSPRLILLDLLMPVMSGLDFLKIYNPKTHSSTGVLLLTNMPSSSDVDQCIKLGVKGVAIKSSLTPTALLELVAENLKS
jgi:CheY-like chemotaxis protein